MGNRVDTSLPHPASSSADGGGGEGGPQRQVLAAHLTSENDRRQPPAAHGTSRGLAPVCDHFRASGAPSAKWRPGDIQQSPEKIKLALMTGRSGHGTRERRGRSTSVQRCEPAVLLPRPAASVNDTGDRAVLHSRPGGRRLDPSERLVALPPCTGSPSVHAFAGTVAASRRS